MPPKIINQRTEGKTPVAPVSPLILPDVTRQAAAASRRAMVPTQPAAGTANHARHHVSRHSQS